MIWFLEDYRDDVLLVVRAQHLGLPAALAARPGEHGRVLELGHGLTGVPRAGQQAAGLRLDARPDGRVAALAQ